MKNTNIYVTIGATLAQSGDWAKRNNVELRQVVTIRKPDEIDLIRGVHGCEITFVGRDQWWMSETANSIIQMMQLLTAAGETVRFITDEQ